MSIQFNSSEYIPVRIVYIFNRHLNLTETYISFIYLDLLKTIYIILLLEGLAVHPKLFRGPLLDRPGLLYSDGTRFFETFCLSVS
jgi:hypothetical protein